MNRENLLLAVSLCAGLLMVGAVALAGSWSDVSVSPGCWEAGNFFYQGTYCCDPNEFPPNCVVITVYKQNIYYTDMLAQPVSGGQICTTWWAWITLDDLGNNYTFNFRVCGGTPSPNYWGPCVVEDKDTDCPCSP